MATWTVLSVIKVIDGDTLKLTRQRVIGEVDGLRITATDVKPVSVRLVHVDSPERGEDGWAQARDDLAAWVGQQQANFNYSVSGRMTLDDAGRDNFGRVLGDLRAPDGDTASLYMVRDRGWNVWMETR